MDAKGLFEASGGEFILSFDDLRKKLCGIKAFLFDWDGVFNTGIKTGEEGSPFAEADAMGTNLVRFGHYLATGTLPHAGIITGMNNPAAAYFAKRENFHTLHFKFKHKIEALEHLNELCGIKGEEVAFVFDDVLDLSLTKVCGLRFLVRRNASPLFTRYAKDKGLCDYISGHGSASHGLREICEVLLAAGAGYERVVDARVEYGGEYQAYLKEKSSLSTRIFMNSPEGVVERGE